LENIRNGQAMHLERGLAAQTVHRNRESSARDCDCFHAADFTEVVFESVVYGTLSSRAPISIFCNVALGEPVRGPKTLVFIESMI
jgi:hypothetical protein